MALLSAMLTGQTGLYAANAGINATSQNVANLLTPGYSRRTASQSVSNPIAYGGYLLGQGVTVDGISRTTDQLLGVRQISEAGLSAAADATVRALQSVETWFDESNTAGLRQHTDAFFDALTAQTADLSDPTLRQQVANSADVLANDLNRTVAGLDDAMRSFLDEVEATIPSINAMLDDVAGLNNAIAAAGGESMAPDLADQRDRVVRSLSETAGVTVSYDNGDATVFIGGHAAVSGGNARTLELVQQPGEAPAIHLSSDGAAVDVTDQIGGQVGGIMSAWERTQTYLDDLDVFAKDLAIALNDQHVQGFDSNGVLGEPLFTFDIDSPAGTLTFNQNVLDDPGLLAFASDSTALVGDGGNLAAMLGIETSGVIGGTDSPGDFLSGLTARVGQELANAESLSAQQAAVISDLDALQANLSSVDLDEEATNLITYQMAYEAAAKVIQTADQMLATLLELR